MRTMMLRFFRGDGKF